MSPLPVVGSGSGISASALNQIIASTMALQRRPLEAMQEEQDRLEIQRAVYIDLQAKLNSLKTETEKLLSSSSSSVLAQKLLTSSDPAQVSATVSSSVGRGVYDIMVNSLATAQRVHSEKQLYSNQSLGLNGSFVIGGGATRAATGAQVVADTVLGFGVSCPDAALANGQIELGSGDYYVEVREFDGAKQFRLVDAEGAALSIAEAGKDATYTNTWQSLDAVAGTTYDTGRGLTIEFGSGPFTAGQRTAGAARVSYTALGATVNVEAEDTLLDIRDAINSATYAAGNRVQATIVDNRLVLTAESTGAAHRIEAVDLDGGTILSGGAGTGLGLLGSGGEGDLDPTDIWKVTTQRGVDASLTVNDLTLTRSKNTGLTDVIAGVTINLLKETAAGQHVTLTVNDDDSAATKQINSFVAQFNAVITYLEQKTAITINSDGKTYTHAALSGDGVFAGLRLSLISDLNRAQSGLSAAAPTSLRQIGLTFDENLKLSVSDSSALQSALAKNRAGVQELLDKVLNKTDGLLRRIDIFTGSSGDSGILGASAKALENEKKYLSDRIASTEERLKAQEALLTMRYSQLLGQYADMQAQASYLSGLLGSTG